MSFAYCLLGVPTSPLYFWISRLSYCPACLIWNHFFVLHSISLAELLIICGWVHKMWVCVVVLFFFMVLAGYKLFSSFISFLIYISFKVTYFFKYKGRLFMWCSNVITSFHFCSNIGPSFVFILFSKVDLHISLILVKTNKFVFFLFYIYARFVMWGSAPRISLV